MSDAVPQRSNPVRVAAALVLGGLFSVVCLCAAIYTALLFKQMPTSRDLADYHPPTASRVYAWDGELIGEFSKVRRIYVPYDQMPPRLITAFLAAEDRDFFSHGAVDVAGVSRAFFKDLGNALQGRRLEGGSTITQQVAKNILADREVRVGRKLKEALVAGSLEQVLTKKQILELYLNEIWLGYRSYGVGAAAYNYFGKSVGELSLAECAYLAALPKGPDNYRPVRMKAAAIRRRNWVLGEMLRWGKISRAEWQAAVAEDLVVQNAPQRTHYRAADYFVDEVRREAERLPAVGKGVDQGGFYLRTTLDSRLQTLAQSALMDGLESYDHRHGWRGPWGHIANVANGWQTAALKANPPPAERPNWKVGLVLSASGKVQLADENVVGQIVGADMGWASGSHRLTPGDLVFVEPASGGGLRLRQIPLANGAIVAMEPYSGRVLAMVGGYSFSKNKFNRATQAWRQPGSSFKPFVYAAALESGQFTPASIVLDAPISLNGGGGENWSPENYEHTFLGSLVFRRGLELSLNTMTVRIAMQTKMPVIVDTAKRFGVVDKMEPVLPMALGAGVTTPLRMAGAYSALVNGGRKVSPHLIEVVSDRNGKTLARADRRGCGACRAPFGGQDSPELTPAGEQLINPITAYQIDTMLEGVIQRGTAVAARPLGRPMGGKTGTTNDYRSAWFVGFTPQIVVAVYVGRDDNVSLGEGETGAQAALPIFISFMREAEKDMPAKDFVPPADTRFAFVGPNREAFRPGTEPRVVATPVQTDAEKAAELAVTPITPPAKPIQASPPTVVDRPPRPSSDVNGLF